MLAAETAADKAAAGWVTREQVTLTVTPTGTSYAWSIAKPSASGSACALSATSGASVTFTPDVEGYFTVVCVVDGSTTYVLRMAVVAVASATTLSVSRLLPLSDSQVATPSTGVALYYSSTQSGLSYKDTSGVVHKVTVTP
jgi:hypothetical protein